MKVCFLICTIYIHICICEAQSTNFNISNNDNKVIRTIIKHQMEDDTHCYSFIIDSLTTNKYVSWGFSKKVFKTIDSNFFLMIYNNYNIDNCNNYKIDDKQIFLTECLSHDTLVVEISKTVYLMQRGKLFCMIYLGLRHRNAGEGNIYILSKKKFSKVWKITYINNIWII